MDILGRYVADWAWLAECATCSPPVSVRPRAQAISVSSSSGGGEEGSICMQQDATHVLIALRIGCDYRELCRSAPQRIIIIIVSTERVSS
eukprot:3472315-Pleurochrysis_carterae.AAC.4